MADRQDIDALMIGALYGELDAAESARLDAHLSSHPEDRAAMDGLSRTRATLRQNLAAMPSAEPPQAISALLLQAAARQAPSRAAAVEPEQPGLWIRFVAWLRPLTLNPALAGAAALVLVGGTATALWYRSGGRTVEPVRHEAAQAAPPGAPGFYRGQGDEAPAATATGTITADGIAAGSGSADTFAADLTEGRDDASREAAGLAAPVKAELKEQANERGRAASADPSADKLVAMPEESTGAKQAGGGKGKAPAKADTGGYVAIDARDVAPAPKDLDDDAQQDEDLSAGDAAGAGGAARNTAARQPAAEPKPVDPALEDWAKGAHSRLVKLVRDGKCPEAGRLGAEIKDRAPDYYAASVANDRAIRGCKQYIEGQAKKKAEKDYKSRSQGNAVDLETEAR